MKIILELLRRVLNVLEHKIILELIESKFLIHSTGEPWADFQRDTECHFACHHVFAGCVGSSA